MFVELYAMGYLILCDLDQRELSRNIFDSRLESSQRDSNLRHAQLLQFQNYLRAQNV